VYNIASISIFILVSAQLPRTLNLILENNLVSLNTKNKQNEYKQKYKTCTK
jgi:hypothetical protein